MLATRHIVGLSLLAAVSGGSATSRAVADVEDVSAKETIRIIFAVAEGTKLRKTFTRELELTTRESDGSLGLGTWNDSQRIVLIDEYGSLVERIPETITRSFECIEVEHSHGWETTRFLGEDLSRMIERKGTGELSGSRVTFKRDYAEPEIPFGMPVASYVAEFADDSALPDETVAALAGLRANTDSTGLLPWREVAIGSIWFVDVDAFHEVCWPSGALRFVDSDDEPLVTPVDERLGQNLDGTFRIELRAIEKIAGVRYARMSIRGILESQATFPYEWSIGFARGGSLSFEGSITLGLYASLQGRFWWNLDEGHLDSIHIEGDVTVHQKFGETQVGRWTLPGLAAHVWTGKLSADAEFERL
ncbi:MAG: hypothetical protein E2O39_14765 [Planctomycetota bacterium]|nr:MAG: hypothetical protein E2O39_14765 [Planctomycetota bacterium]